MWFSMPLPKPFSLDELLTRVQRVHQQRQTREKLIAEAARDEPLPLKGALTLRFKRRIARQSRQVYKGFYSAPNPGETCALLCRHQNLRYLI